MRYRKLDANGDFSFGRQQLDFYRDQVEAVGQAAQTRLGLELGEWFLDVTDGTPYRTEVLGYNTSATRDPAIEIRIMGTQGFSSLEGFVSYVDAQRHYVVQAQIDTVYGLTHVESTV